MSALVQCLAFGCVLCRPTAEPPFDRFRASTRKDDQPLRCGVPTEPDDAEAT